MAVTINGTDGVTFNDGSEQWAAASPIGTKNLIINGDMRIAQRGTSATGKTTSGYYTCDRWNHVFSGAGTWTFTQDTDVPTGQGFANSLKMACTTAKASLGAADSFQLHHRFEGQNLQHLKKGTANAESVTLSFWIKSNKTGTYQLNIQDRDNTRMISSTYTIDSADTWEKKILTFAGDTTGAFDNDNNDSIRMSWFLASGSNYNTGSVPTSWEATDTTDIAAGLTVNLADSTSNYLNITGVQLEVGDTATPFEVMPYDMQLARCQRYYFYLDDQGGVTNQVINLGFMYDANRARFFVTFPTTMRTNPTIVSTNIASSFEFNLNGTAVFVPSCSLPFSSAVSVNGALLQGTADSGTGTAGESRYVRIVISGAKIEFGAEL